MPRRFTKAAQHLGREVSAPVCFQSPHLFLHLPLSSSSWGCLHLHRGLQVPCHLLTGPALQGQSLTSGLFPSCISPLDPLRIMGQAEVHLTLGFA